MTTTDPAIAHSANLAKLMENMEGKKIAVPASMRLPDEPEPAPEQVVSAESIPAPAEAPPTPPVEPPRSEELAASAAEEAAPLPAKASGTDDAQKADKTPLAKRIEIQRRAREAMERARKAASSLRSRKPAPQVPDKAAEQTRLLQQEKERISTLQARLESEINLAQSDPFAFARRHGMDPARMAQYVKEGLDPNKVALDRLRQETAQAIKQIRDEYQGKLQELQNQFIAAEEARAQHNFFTFVEEAKAANPEAFAALNSGLVYSDADVWNVANKILEKDADLRNNFSEDKLLEAVEAEARKDPRWSRVQALLKNSTNSAKQTKQTNEQPQSKSNVSATEEVKTPEKTRAPDGKFSPPPRARSPFEEHQIHLQNVMRRSGIFR